MLALARARLIARGIAGRSVQFSPLRGHFFIARDSGSACPG